MENQTVTQTVDEKLAQHRALIYDCEILKCIPNENEMRDPNYQYCRGWGDKRGMEISVIGAYDYVTGDYLVFLGDNLNDFATLVASRNIVIGFNNKRFDDPLCEAHGIIIPASKSYDLHQEITKKVPPGERGGFKLDALLKANGLHTKSGDGAEAPRMAQRGEWGALINYVLCDAKCTVQLMRAVCNRTVVSPKNGGVIENVELPWDVVKGSELGGLY
jgi:hypothetical protein